MSTELTMWCRTGIETKQETCLSEKEKKGKQNRGKKHTTNQIFMIVGESKLKISEENFSSYILL